MNNKMKIAATAALLAVSAGVSAQNTYSGYFLDGYNYRYQLNPAFGNERNFVSFPALGNLNIDFRGSLHLEDVIHNVDGRTVLFTNPGVSDKFLKDIPSRSKLEFGTKINVLSGGWKAWGGYNTVSINAVAGAGLSLPKSFFELAKEGLSNKTYNIGELNARAQGYAEIALNHSRDIPQVPGLRAGAAVKFLIGVANVEADFKNARLTLGEDSWKAQTNADINVNLGKFQYETKTRNDAEGKPYEYVSGANMKGDGSVGPNGFGMAFDLGATYKWNDFDFSLALLDMGWISWFNTKNASTNGLQTIDTDAYTFNANDDAPNSFENEWDRLSDQLNLLYQPYDNGDTGTRSTALAATLNVGVNYTLPYYRRLHFGLLSTTKMIDKYAWTELRLSANVNPVNCFSADANIVVGTYGFGFGWMLNYANTGFSIFLGMDHTLGKLAKQGVPLRSNGSVNFGINFPF